VVDVQRAHRPVLRVAGHDVAEHVNAESVEAFPVLRVHAVCVAAAE
jgi:hypothetical protein